MGCPNCGADIENRRFCGKCGTAVPAAAPPGPPPPPPAPAGSPPAPAGYPPPGQWAPPSTWGPPVAAPPAPPPEMPPPGMAPPATDPFTPPNLSAPPGFGAPPPPGYPPPGYPPPGYPAPPGSWAGAAYGPPKNNGLAVAALVLGLVGWIPCGVGSVLAVIFGFVARDQIKRAQGRESGAGLAIAGIVLGVLAIALWAAIFIAGLAHSGRGTT